MNRSPYQSCHRKKPYTEADATARVLAKREEGTILAAYRCTWCKEWHVGHLPVKVRLKEAAGDKRLTPRRKR